VRPSSVAQRKYVTELAKDYDVQITTDLDDTDIVDAWLGVLFARRSIVNLERLRPEVGDIVGVIEGGEILGEVTSISHDGRINLKGGRGRGIRPHKAQILSGIDDDTEEARKTRGAAERSALLQEPLGPPGKARLAALQRWKVEGRPSAADVAELIDVLEDAADEKPLQQLLQTRPELLSGIVTSNWGFYVIPQKKLGAEYVPDFLIAGIHSGGIHWTLVELESPSSRITIKDGREAKEVRKGVSQIGDWRDWLQDNLAYARNLPKQNGMGLVDIRPGSRGLVLVGRRSTLTDASERMRHRLNEKLDITLHTYDWLVDVAARSSQGALGGALDMEVEEFTDEPPF
jgi:hypothetical protein